MLTASQVKGKAKGKVPGTNGEQMLVVTGSQD